MLRGRNLGERQHLQGTANVVFLNTLGLGANCQPEVVRMPLSIRTMKYGLAGRGFMYSLQSHSSQYMSNQPSVPFIHLTLLSGCELPMTFSMPICCYQRLSNIVCF